MFTHAYSFPSPNSMSTHFNYTATRLGDLLPAPAEADEETPDAPAPMADEGAAAAPAAAAAAAGGGAVGAEAAGGGGGWLQGEVLSQLTGPLALNSKPEVRWVVVLKSKGCWKTEECACQITMQTFTNLGCYSSLLSASHMT